MVRRPGVENRVKQRFIVEIAIAPVDRQPRRGNGHEESAGAAPDHLVMCARRDDDDLVPEARRGAQLGFDIGADPAAEGAVKGANVEDPHCADEAGSGG